MQRMAKFAVYRWRLDSDIKRCLKDAARAEKTSFGRLLDRIAREWLQEREAEEEAEQQRLRAEAAKWIGSINSGDRYGSERVRERVRAKLFAKHRRLRREAPGFRRR
jgi:hypothetical protein